MATSELGELSVSVGLDTSELDKGEVKVAASSGRIQKSLTAMGDAVSKAFASTTGSSVTRGLVGYLGNAEKSFGAFSHAIQGNAFQTATSLSSFAQASVKASQSAAPAINSLASSATNARSILIAGIVTGVVIAGINSLATAANQSITSMDKMATASSQIGVPIERFSALSFAAKSTGVSVEDFSSMYTDFAKNLDKDDAFSPALRALQAMGIESNSVTKATKPLDTILAEVANKFSRMEPGINKTTLATSLFGDKGAELIPMLDRGSAGIDQLTKKAQELGSILGQKAAADARAYSEEVARLNAVTGTASKALGEALMPVMKGVVTALADFAEKVNAANVVGNVFRSTLGGMYLAGRSLLVVFESIGTVIHQVASALVKASTGDFKGAAAELSNTGEKLKEVFSKFGQDAVATFDYVAPSITKNITALDQMRGSIAAVGETAKKVAAPALRSTEEIQKGIDKAKAAGINAWQELMKDQSIPLTEKIAQLKAMVDKGSISWQQYYTSVRVAKEMQYQLNTELAKMNLEDTLGNKKLPMTQKIEELQAAVRSGSITFREFSGMMRQVNDEGQNNMNDLASTTSQALTTIFKENKAAAIASAIINTFQGVTKALASYPPPYSFAMAGLQAAMGFAQVNAIRNTNKNGGGGGGAAGVSSAASAATSAQAANQSGGNASESTLFVQGIDPKGLFTGEVVRSLAGKLVDFQKNGGRVIIGGAT